MIRGLFKRAAAPVAQMPDGERVYAIGDIHGRSDLLDRLHALIAADVQARPQAEARLIYLGDYIDRGPDTSGVLERLTAGPLLGLRRILLRGNHEEMLLRFLQDPSAGTAWRQLGGMETLLSYRVDINAVLADKGFAGLADELKRRLPLPHLTLLGELQSSISVGDYFFCHAGVRAGVPLERQRDADLLWIRTEFLNSTADFGKIIVHGHSPVEEADFRPNRINIDTGADATNRLTCLVLEASERSLLAT
jgi:serine/threonine protein phosphatase 1